MKTLHKEIKPKYQAPATLLLNGNIIATVPCNLWLPRHRHEKPFFTFETEDPTHYKIKTESSFFDISIIFGEEESYKIEIYAERVFIPNFTSLHRGSGLPSITTFDGHPEKLTCIQHLGMRSNPSKKQYITLRLTDNFLLSPDKIITKSYTGEVTAETIRSHKFDLNGFSNVLFDKHFYYLESSDSGTEMFSGLVACLEFEDADNIFSEFDATYKDQLKDYILISSFASDQATFITSITYHDSTMMKDVWYGNLAIEKTKNDHKHGHNDVLVDLSDFEKFISTCFSNFQTFDYEKQELIRRAIYKVLPRGDSTIESKILDYFSAIESIVLIYRREKGMEFTIADGYKWKTLEKSIRKSVNENKELFESDEHLSLLKNMLPSLKRVPFKNAFEGFQKSTGMINDDLWPLFDNSGGASLSEIRNQIIHGEAFREDQSTALFHAMMNLESLAQRTIFITLGWNITDTNVSPMYLKSVGWTGNKNIENDMKMLSD